jgi:hypothetical protein
VEATAIEKSFSVTSIVLPDVAPPPPPAAAVTVVAELPAPPLLPQALAASVTAPTSARIRAVRVNRRWSYGALRRRQAIGFTMPSHVRAFCVAF